MIDFSTNLIFCNVQISELDLYEKLYRRRIANAEEIVSAYSSYGKATGIGNLLPVSQAIHETGWFTSKRWLENNNPAGIGATNDGAIGNKWDNPSAGILAQFAHLTAYALPADSQNNFLVNFSKMSPRYAVLAKNKLLGIAPKWIDLNGRWAVPGTTYAQKISDIANFLLAK